jgi:3-hydroxy-9,10-secoandrosta-1,3,5(10)-triene-9,17-dione monooxygenase
MTPQDTVTGIRQDRPTQEELLDRAREMAPRLRERAARCEAERCVPVETIEDYRQSGLIRMSMPARYNGYELGWDVLCEVTQILAAACGSQAWIQRICADHAQMVATFPAQTQEDVWGADPDVLVSAAFDPVGRAKKVDGGFIYSGRHGFSSGIDHASWMICGGFIQDGERLDGPHFFLVPRTDAVVIDDWHVVGLAGTGSKSFEVKDAFVPGHRFLDGAKARIGASPGSKINDAAVYRTPRGGITSTGFAALCVGMARGILEDWYTYTRPRKSRGIPIAKQESVQVMAARCHAEIDAAEALYLNIIRDAMRRLERRETLSEMYLATARRNVAYACLTSLEAATRLFNAGGGRLLYEGNPIARQYQNLLGGAAHHGVNWERAAQMFGALTLDGGES